MSDQIHRQSTELNVLVPSVWSQRYFDVLLQELPFNALLDRSYEGEISNLGDTVKISSFPEFSEATELAEDARNDADALTVTQQSLTINKRIAKDFIVTSLAMMQSLPAMDKLKELAVYSINKKIQTAIIALIVPSASAPDHSIAYDSGTTLALADALEAKELLDAQNVPLSDRHMVLGSAQLNDLFNITGMVSSDFGATNAPLLSGNLPAQILGFTPHYTTAVSTVSYFFHKSFMTIAAQQGMETKMYDMGGEGKRSFRVNSDTLLGIKQLSGLRVVSIS